jgi:hypothetical protein
LRCVLQVAATSLTRLATLAPDGVDAFLYALDGVLERLQVLATGIPQDGRIGLVIVVPENVADAGNCSPRDVRLVLLKLIGETAACFGKNLEVSFNKLPSASIRTKLLEVIPCGVRLDVGDGIEDVTDVDSRVLFH